MRRAMLHDFFFSCVPTVSTIACSSGNCFVFSFEYSSSPLTVNSKQPPLEGISFRSCICCLNVVSSLAVRLTAWGS